MTSGFQMMKKYENNGWKFLRHGSRHDIFVNENYPEEVSIPRHSSELKSGLEKKLLAISRKTQKKEKKAL